MVQLNCLLSKVSKFQQIHRKCDTRVSTIDLYLRDLLDEVALVFVFNNVDSIRSAPRDELHLQQVDTDARNMESNH